MPNRSKTKKVQRAKKLKRSRHRQVCDNRFPQQQIPNSNSNNSSGRIVYFSPESIELAIKVAAAMGGIGYHDNVMEDSAD